MHGAALVFGVGEHLGDRADHAGRLVAREHAHAAQPAGLEPRQEVAPALRRLGEALGAADRLAAAVLVHADRCHDRHVLAGAAPASLQAEKSPLNEQPILYRYVANKTSKGCSDRMRPR